MKYIRDVVLQSELKRIFSNIVNDFSLTEPFLYRVCCFGGTGSSAKTGYT